jgi:5-methylcytosine-specific restriction endonuclease McrA
MDHDEREAAAVAFGRALREESATEPERIASNARAYRQHMLKARGQTPNRPQRRRGTRRQRARRELRRTCLQRQGYKCHYCQIPISDMDGTATLDHVMPVSKGGAVFDLDNCVAACGPCNTAKADALPSEINLRARLISGHLPEHPVSELGHEPERLARSDDS